MALCLLTHSEMGAGTPVQPSAASTPNQSSVLCLVPFLVLYMCGQHLFPVQTKGKLCVNGCLSPFWEDLEKQNHQVRPLFSD